MSCLFRSLSKGINIHEDLLRKVIVDYIKTNPVLLDDIKAADVINWTEGQDLDKYARRMYHSYAWGGAIEIRAFCNLFHVNVCVHVLYTNKKFTIESARPNPVKTIHISYNGSHFEPMFTIINRTAI